MRSEFRNDIISGLSKPIKTLPSKYFYDKKGDSLFQQIMDMEEYYLPQLENEIIENSSQSIIDKVLKDSKFLNIIELGAGDGRKTVEFLKKLNTKKYTISYFPLDISQHILDVNKRLIEKQNLSLKVNPVAGDYFNTISSINPEGRKLVMFLGSNIGNYSIREAESFFKHISNHLDAGDFILVAFDLKKNPHKILAAYNDAGGVTKAFNLNLLERINRELKADFKIEKFDHYATYDPLTGKTASYIISLDNQTVHIENTDVIFAKDESIHVEVSYKYDLGMINALCTSSDLNVVDHFTDKNKEYSLSLFQL